MELVYWGIPFALIAIIGGFRRFMRIRHYVYLLVLVISTYVLLGIIDFFVHNNMDELWLVTIFLGSILITIGWMVTNEITLMNNRKHHTINLITDYISGYRHITDRRIIRRMLPDRNEKLLDAIINFDDENNSTLQAIDRELNFFEFLSIGVKSGDLDYYIVRESVRANLCDFVSQMEYYIRHWRNKDLTTWENLVDIYNQWK